MRIETGQVLVVDYNHLGGTITRRYFRTDGDYQYGFPAAQEFVR